MPIYLPLQPKFIEVIGPSREIVFRGEFLLCSWLNSDEKIGGAGRERAGRYFFPSGKIMVLEVAVFDNVDVKYDNLLLLERYIRLISLGGLRNVFLRLTFV